MRSNPRVDLHCHTLFSDGALEPEELVDRLVAADVAFAALTDHDTIDGLERFRAAAARRGLVAINGVELTVQHQGREVHLLGYGFTIDDAFKSEIHSLRQQRLTAIGRNGAVHSIEASLLQSSYNPAGESHLPPIQHAIELIHKAGGKAFLAHPLLYETDPRRLLDLFADLKKLGLDGIEAIYGAFSLNNRKTLCDIANNLNLLVSAGMDQHSADPDSEFGIAMPASQWREFRKAVLPDVAGDSAQGSPVRRRLRLRQFALHIIVPTLLAIALFVVAIFGLLLPKFEKSLMERKRELIRELTNSAISILAEAQQQEAKGVLTHEQAMQLAKSRIASFRYGMEGKSYFWLQDLNCRMIMHPYRPDLDGKDLTQFRDARGNAIFVEFTDVVKRQGEGYVEYVWQWNDDPTHLAPKESYIRGFKPWGWIIGTGIYLDDVREEISRLERGLAIGSASISVVVILLLAYVIRESLRIERNRSNAENDLQESRERYRCLIEAASEGALLLLQGRCRYANPVLLDMLGLSAGELELMDMEDLLGPRGENAAAWDAIELATYSGKAADGIPARLKKRDGHYLNCTIAVRPMDFPGRIGLILQVRPESIVHKSPDHMPMIERLLQLPSNEADGLAIQISKAPTPDEIASLCKTTPSLVRSLLDCGAHPRHITRLVSCVCDAATTRLVHLAQNTLGPAPAPFAFIAMGSQGRWEQTLCTDQDNAIIYDDSAANSPSADAYFQELGQFVCKGLSDAGYLLCSGNVMASNPKWRMSLEGWSRCFSQWIDKSEPRELLDFSIFFDFRAVCGEESLVAALRASVRSDSAAAPDFLARFAQNSIQFKSPRWVFGRLIGGESQGTLDLKLAMLPIVAFARLYSLRHGLSETGTLDRMSALAALGMLPQSTHLQIRETYESLMRIRLKCQSEMIALGQPADNFISPSTLSHIELAILKESFAEIDACQQRIAYDFLGGSPV